MTIATIVVAIAQMRWVRPGSGVKADARSVDVSRSAENVVVHRGGAAGTGGPAIKIRRTRERTDAAARTDERAAQHAEAQAIVSELEALTSHRTASTTPRHSGRLLGSLLIARGLVVQDDLDRALARQRRTGQRLGEIVVEMGLVRERDVTEMLAEQLRLEVLDLTRASTEARIGKRLPEAHARRLVAIPFRPVGTALAVAVADPTQPHLVTELTQLLGVPVRIYVTTTDVVMGLIDRAYGRPPA